jgi:hypothetical protein
MAITAILLVMAIGLTRLIVSDARCLCKVSSVSHSSCLLFSSLHFSSLLRVISNVISTVNLPSHFSSSLASHFHSQSPESLLSHFNSHAPYLGISSLSTFGNLDQPAHRISSHLIKTPRCDESRLVLGFWVGHVPLAGVRSSRKGRDAHLLWMVTGYSPSICYHLINQISFAPIIHLLPHCGIVIYLLVFCLEVVTSLLHMTSA